MFLILLMLKHFCSLYPRQIISTAHLFPQIILVLNPPVTWVLMPGLRSPVSGPLKLVMLPRTLRAPAELDISPTFPSDTLFLSYLSLKIWNFVSELNLSSGKT